MKNWLGVLFIGFVLAGCSASTENRTNLYQMPPEMADCKVFKLEGDGLTKTLYVVKCPKSTTTTQWEESQGKSGSRSYSVTVDSD